MPEGQRPRGVTPRPRSGAVAESARLDGTGTAERSYPASEARGGGREEQPNVQGAVATQGQEGLEELSHVEGHEQRLRGDTPHPR